MFPVALLYHTQHTHTFYMNFYNVWRINYRKDLARLRIHFIAAVRGLLYKGVIIFALDSYPPFFYSGEQKRK